MLELYIKETYRRMAESEMPPSQISIPTAGRAGRSWPRRRRAGLIAAPVFAAAAVLAIALATSGLPVGTGPWTSATAGGSPAGYFNPLVPYAAYGRLPAGWQTWGESGGDTMTLEAAPQSGAQLVTWAAFAPGVCHLAGRMLDCRDIAVRLAGAAPAVNGRRAYWGNIREPSPTPIPGSLAGAYIEDVRANGGGIPATPTMVLAYRTAAAGWAALEYGKGQDQDDVLRIARNIRTNLTTSLRFAVQLTGEPAGHVAAADFVQTKDGLLGDYFLVRFPWGTLEVTTGPPWLATELPGCSPHLTVVPPGGPASRLQSLCRQRDGLVITMTLVAPAKAARPNLQAIFARHLRVLGTDPARWTTSPVG
jgi:hypothetical protein